MRIIGIDPGTACGWAVYEGRSVVASGTWDLSSRRFEGGGMRFVRFRKLFSELLWVGGPADLVAYEEVRRHLGVDAAHVYGGITSHLQQICEEARVPYTAIPVATVKKLATGKGNADKLAMIAAANQKWALQLGPKDDDEADARWIAQAAAEEHEVKREAAPTRSQPGLPSAPLAVRAGRA